MERFDGLETTNDCLHANLASACGTSLAYLQGRMLPDTLEQISEHLNMELERLCSRIYQLEVVLD